MNKKRSIPEVVDEKKRLIPEVVDASKETHTRGCE
jgi:hypothetical protein